MVQTIEFCIEDSFDKGLKYADQGDFKSAIPLLEKAVDLADNPLEIPEEDVYLYMICMLYKTYMAYIKTLPVDSPEFKEYDYRMYRLSYGIGEDLIRVGETIKSAI